MEETEDQPHARAFAHDKCPDENLNQANKLSRTCSALTEALDRHRGKGRQHITVEHVNVHDGGQAIVGAVTPGVGAVKERRTTNAARETTHEPGTPLRNPDPERETVPIAGGTGKAPVSNAWWCGWKGRSHRKHECTPARSLHRRSHRSPASGIRTDQDGAGHPRRDQRAELEGVKRNAFKTAVYYAGSDPIGHLDRGTGPRSCATTSAGTVPDGTKGSAKN
jgi:hypothetical protein